jgi:1-deoxy-D-xylulose 5-phosphate reductoisomerase
MEQTETKSEEEKVNYEQAFLESANELNNLKFFSDQIRFNSIVYQGMGLILEKVTNIETLLSKIEEEKKDDKPKAE